MQSMAFAGPQPGQTQIVEIMRMARDPDLTRSQKMEAAQKGLDYIRAQVGEGQLKSITEDTFKDPELEKKLGFYETKGLGAVYTEFNQLIRDIEVNDKLQACHAGKGAHSRAIQQGMTQADPCSRGQVTMKYLYYNGKKDGDVTVYQHQSPAYSYSQVNALLQVGSLGRFFDEKNDGKNPYNPTLEQVKKANPNLKENAELNGVAAVSELRGNIYREAIQREIQNKLSLDYRYSEPEKTDVDIKLLAHQYIKDDCKHCTTEMKNQIFKSIGHLWDKEKNTDAKRKSIQQISENLCAELKQQGYWFEPSRKAHELQRQSSAMPLFGNYESSAEMSPGQNMDSGQILEKNAKILVQISQKGNDFALLLTDALTKSKSGEEKDIQLKCSDESLAHDQALVRKAYQEAKAKTEAFSKSINDNIHPNDHSGKTHTKDIEHLVRFAPTAVGLALQDSKTDPAMAGFICGVLKNVENEKRADAALDSLIMWGGTIAGGVATIATAGAAGPFFYAGLAASASVNLATTYYSWDKSGEAHELAKQYAKAAIAQGGDPALMNMSREEFEKFKQYRFDAILSGAFTAGEVASLITIGAKSGKSLATINRELKEAALDSNKKVALLTETKPKVNATVSDVPVKAPKEKSVFVPKDPDEASKFLTFRNAYEENNFEKGDLRFISYQGRGNQMHAAKVIRKDADGGLIVQDLILGQRKIPKEELDQIRYSPWSREEFRTKKFERIPGYGPNEKVSADKVYDFKSGKVVWEPNPNYQISENAPYLAGDELVPDTPKTLPGVGLNARELTERVTKNYTNDQVEKLNGAVLGHSSNSSSLLAFTEYNGKKGGLIPTGQLEAQGKVPFSGEINFGRSGVNQDSLSTVLITEKKTVSQYTRLNTEGWSFEKSQKKALENVPSKDDLLNPTVKNDYEIEKLRREQWTKLTSEEKNLVSDPFPIVYGIEPKRVGVTHSVSSAVHYEVGLKDGASVDEIKSIFVPKDKIEYVKQMLNEKMGEKAKHIRVEDIGILQN